MRPTTSTPNPSLYESKGGKPWPRGGEVVVLTAIRVAYNLVAMAWDVLAHRHRPVH